MKSKSTFRCTQCHQLHEHYESAGQRCDPGVIEARHAPLREPIVMHLVSQHDHDHRQPLAIKHIGESVRRLMQHEQSE